MDFKDVRKLEDRSVEKGERWIYSAGFNVKPDLKSTERIDEELEDIKQIAESGGIVIILSHQGRLADGDVRHLDFVADYLSKNLGQKVEYFTENTTKKASKFVKSLKPGQIAIMGNTRFHKGEEKNNLKLAKKFSKLGDFIAVGGFSKAHRKNASNVGILNYKPGYITRSSIKEMKLLEPWSGKKDEYSVAILGGVKKEKITTGLVGFSEIYDFIIPGGIVLNTILKVKGYEVGDSVIQDNGKTFEGYIQKVLDGKNGNKIYIPSEVFIAKKVNGRFKDSKLICIPENIPNGYGIVDFILDEKAEKILEKTVNCGGRILLAGTPTLYKHGFKTATDQCLYYLERPEVKSIILGGDSITEIPSKRTKSSGGGSSLEFLCTGTTVVYEALKKNKQTFKH